MTLFNTAVDFRNRRTAPRKVNTWNGNQQGVNQHTLVFRVALKKGGLYMEQWWTWISEVGFPIVVTFYLLHRIEQRLDNVTKTLQQLPYHMTFHTQPKRSTK